MRSIGLYGLGFFDLLIGQVSRRATNDQQNPNGGQFKHIDQHQGQEHDKDSQGVTQRVFFQCRDEFQTSCHDQTRYDRIHALQGVLGDGVV